MSRQKLLRANSRLRKYLDDVQIELLEHSAQSIQRLLPHIEVENWTEQEWEKPKVTWESVKRTTLKIVIAVGVEGESGARSLTSKLSRRKNPNSQSSEGSTLDDREYEICRLIAERIRAIFGQDKMPEASSLQAIISSFDENIVAAHVDHHHRFKSLAGNVFRALHTLSEQSYENKALTFGCILDPKKSRRKSVAKFPSDFLESKKYKALSDGFRTAYVVASNGSVERLVDLEKEGDGSRLTEKNYFPDWAESLASCSKGDRCGIALSRQGDLLVFEAGTLRLTYRYGRWQYWNHSFLIKLLRNRAVVQRVPPVVVGRVVGTIYRAALDVSFRRSGGLFVILRNKKKLHHVVKLGDAIGDKKRGPIDEEFDAFITQNKIQTLPRAVVVELASLDGAVVLNNSGRIVAYGAVLQPRKKGKLRGSEGSRTKAAIGASNYGLAVKISSDGDISVYSEGVEFLHI